MKDDDQKKATGIKINPYGVKFNMAGVFMLWKGALINEDMIEEFERSTNRTLRLPGYTNFSLDLKMAMKYSQNNQPIRLKISVTDPDLVSYAIDNSSQSQERKPVVIVMCCQNYRGFKGVKIGNEINSAYPSEGEVLLQESCEV